MKMLLINRNRIVSIFVGMLLIYGAHGISYGQDEAPTVTPGENNTSLIVDFSAVCDEDENAYQVQFRRKSPQGAWTTRCVVAIRNYGSTFLIFFHVGGVACIRDRAIFGDLEPGVTYEARYRDTHLSECVENPPSPGPWSSIGEGTTHLVAPPRVEFVDATLAEAVRRALRLDVKGEHIDLLKIPKAKVAELTRFERHHFLTPMNVKDLTGLEHATQLTELDHLTRLRRGDGIRDLTPLAGLTRLTKVNLGENDISDLTPLAGLTQLRELNLYRNEVRDLTPLAGLTQLTNGAASVAII